MQYCYYNVKKGAVFIDTDKEDAYRKKIEAPNKYSPVLNALSLYLFRTRGIVTMKKIQSRFKNLKYTCAEWGVLCAFAGIALQGTNKSPSNWYVAI